MKNENTPHILNTSSNLMGICFIVVTYLNTASFSQKGPVDDFVGIAAIIFASSCLISFLSMKTKNEKRANKYELLADSLFFSGILILILVLVVGFYWFF